MLKSHYYYYFFFLRKSDEVFLKTYLKNYVPSQINYVNIHMHGSFSLPLATWISSLVVLAKKSQTLSKN